MPYTPTTRLGYFLCTMLMAAWVIHIVLRIVDECIRDRGYRWLVLGIVAFTVIIWFVQHPPR